MVYVKETPQRVNQITVREDSKMSVKSMTDA